MKTFIKENWSKVLIVIIVVVLVLLIVKFFANSNQPAPMTKPTTEITPNAQIANPASLNCINNGGKLSIVDKPEGQVGMCTFSDGTVCEEWAYFRGQCQKK